MKAYLEMMRNPGGAIRKGRGRGRGEGLQQRGLRGLEVIFWTEEEQKW